MVPSALSSINRPEGELRGRFQGPKGEGIEIREKKEEERRENEAEALPNRNRDHSLLRSLFCVLRTIVD